MPVTSIDEQRGLLLQETAMVSWHEIERHFARGIVVVVAAELDLLDVAMALSRDDKGLVQQWLLDDKLSSVSTEQARDWLQRDPALWSVVIAPWVLVQERSVN